MPFVHPHPYVRFIKSNMIMHHPFDLAILDPQFMLSLLLCSRWLARSCMRHQRFISNNNAHLVLYGGGGTGKSFIMGILSSNIPTYKFLTTGKFQNPDILSSAVLLIDEFATRDLVENQYKSLLDIKSSVKLDFKNLHPENATAEMPCIITSNDDILSMLNAQINQSKGKINQNSVDAAIRRLYIVPMKYTMGFDQMHGLIDEAHPLYSLLLSHSKSYQNERDKLNRIFNAMISFALYQADIQGFVLLPELQPLFTKLAKDMQTTIFGSFFT